MDEPRTRSEIAEIVREEARDITLRVLADHTIPAFPAYFLEGRWLITYDWWSEYHQQTLDKEAQLEKRVTVLERPWWRRWFSR